MTIRDIIAKYADCHLSIWATNKERNELVLLIKDTNRLIVFTEDETLTPEKWQFNMLTEFFYSCAMEHRTPGEAYVNIDYAVEIYHVSDITL